MSDQDARTRKEVVGHWSNNPSGIRASHGVEYMSFGANGTFFDTAAFRLFRYNFVLNGATVTNFQAINGSIIIDSTRQGNLASARLR
jgi:hypothetical protein